CGRVDSDRPGLTFRVGCYGRWPMAISYRDPFAQLQRELESMLERAFGTEGPSSLYPPVNLFDAGEHYVVKAELPGVRPEDLELTVQDNTLVLRGERTLPETAQTRPITAGSEARGSSGAWCVSPGRRRASRRPSFGT